MTQLHIPDPHPSNGKTRLDQLLNCEGEMGELIRTFDWASTSLGSIEAWPQSLWTAVSICLFSRFPMIIWWGRDLVAIYNDAYRPLLGTNKHPYALGQRGQETWSEIWNIIGPMLDSVFQAGQATWSYDQILMMDRFGFIEETYFTFSYSPIFDEVGGVGGIFTAVTETTERVLSERRLKTLYDLGEHASEGKSAIQSCRIAAAELAKNQADVPFALLYLLDDSQRQATLASSAGVDAASPLARQTIDLSVDGNYPWPLAQVLADDQLAVVTDLSARFTTLPTGLWDVPPTTAVILPIAASGYTHTTGVLIIGVSPRLALDEEYRHFYELVVGHIATAIANARAYEEERKRAESLAELDRAKTEFFSNISHEFRTPLTLMLNPLQEVLQAADALTDDQRETLETAYRNSLRLQKLVNTLLDFSRIQSNRIRSSFEPVDLAALTTDLASTFRSVVERAGLRLMVNCPPLPEPVYIDREMWEKIVLNLLSNAFKFTFEGEITVTLRMVDRTVELQVQDTGIGIAEADLPHIFERFHRVLGARARTYEGSGIGLALVAELVRFHSGQIAVNSNLGEGTSFTVSVPLGTAHLPADQIHAPRTSASTAVGVASYTEEALRWLSDGEQEEQQTMVAKFDTSETIATQVQRSDATLLIVDDNADMRQYLRRLLEARYYVATANDGLAALAYIEANPPTLVVADIMMPTLDGFGLLQKLRSTDSTRLLPVILLSARAGEEARIEGLQAGANDYLTKPFSARELLARVDAQIQLAQLRQRILETEQAARVVAEAERERISNLLNSMSDSYVLVDREFRYTYLNPQAQSFYLDLTGEPGEAFIGRTIWEKFPGAEESIFGQNYKRALQEKQSSSVEAYFPPVNRWLDVRVHPTDDGLSIYFQDITPRKQAEKDLQQYALDLKRSNQELEQFAYLASHDLQEPLRMVTSYLQLIEQRYARLFDQDAHEFIGYAIDGAARMKALITDLLMYSRVKTAERDFAPFSTEAALKTALKNMKFELEDAQAEVVYNNLPSINGNAQQFVQLFQNLIGNAIEFHGEKPPLVQISARRDGDNWLFSVRDNGIGIAEEHLNRIFVMFQRLHTKEEYPGTGIGLSICKKVVEHHLGQLWAESKLGEGTTFYFTIPAETDV